MSNPKKNSVRRLAFFGSGVKQGKVFDTTKFRHEGDGIYAFKPQPDRYLCFFIKGKKIIVTNVFRKKSEKLPEREKERALKAESSYERRVKEGSYYETKV